MKKPRRKRCDECGELVPPDELVSVKDEAFNAVIESMVTIVMLVCEDCIEAMNEPAYGIYGDREDQIPYDSAMFRD